MKTARRAVDDARAYAKAYAHALLPLVVLERLASSRQRPAPGGEESQHFLLEHGDDGPPARRRELAAPAHRPRQGAARTARTVVLMYHRVAESASDPFGLDVAPARFHRQLEVASRVAEIVPLREVTRISRKPRLAVTFDDGYADNLEVALPLLEAAAVPTTMFVTTGVTEGAPEFWWDRLSRLLEHEPTAELLDLERPVRVRLDVRTGADRERAVRVLGGRLRPLPPGEIHRVLDVVEAQLRPGDAGTLPRPRLTEQGLRRLATHPLVDVGGHTVEHPLLAVMSPARQRAEVDGVQAMLCRVLGRSASAFAYPFGDRASFDRHTIAAVRSAGFETAFTTIPGPVPPFGLRWRLPRYAVRDWDEIEFESRVREWVGA